MIKYIIIPAMIFFFGCTSDKTPETNEAAAQPEYERAEDAVTMPETFWYEADPSSVFQTVGAPDTIAEDLRHESVMGYVYIQFNDHTWRLEELKPGDGITLHLPDDLLLEAEIRRVRRGESLVSVTADVREPHRGFVSVTHEKNRTVGMIEIYSEKRTFHIRYDGQNDMIYLAEVDPAKLDVPEGSPPLIPPDNGYNSIDELI